ncbi:hypothetical protein TWF730_006097 [Orbilia blumenaviensis]|uniref:Uncharacterized protein n=1 Tax=Orbilia blumenaviensis TaxID=1796055 RepID=A0AAV9TYJ5_9PEZI
MSQVLSFKEWCLHLFYGTLPFTFWMTIFCVAWHYTDKLKAIAAVILSYVVPCWDIDLEDSDDDDESDYGSQLGSRRYQPIPKSKRFNYLESEELARLKDRWFERYCSAELLADPVRYRKFVKMLRGEDSDSDEDEVEDTIGDTIGNRIKQRRAAAAALNTGGYGIDEGSPGEGSSSGAVRRRGPGRPRKNSK